MLTTGAAFLNARILLGDGTLSLNGRYIGSQWENGNSRQPSARNGSSRAGHSDLLIPGCDNARQGLHTSMGGTMDKRRESNGVLSRGWLQSDKEKPPFDSFLPWLYSGRRLGTRSAKEALDEADKLVHFEELLLSATRMLHMNSEARPRGNMTRIFFSRYYQWWLY